MANTKDEAIQKAKKDLARRLNVDASEVREDSTSDADFPDMALGAPRDEEMSGQMITPGWRIRLKAKGETFEYRADKNQIRLYSFRGQNYLV
jgi:hypothetical protein